MGQNATFALPVVSAQVFDPASTFLVASKREPKSGPFTIYNCFRNSRSTLLTSLARSS
jgi:hypothetical protein